MEQQRSSTGLGALERLALLFHPVDVVLFRGNRLFAVTNHAPSVMPPWPSVFSGTIRSHLAARSGLDFDALFEGTPEARENHPIAQLLGTYDEPGPFSVTFVSLARRTRKDEAPGWGVFLPSPAGLVWQQDASGLSGHAPEAVRMAGSRGDGLLGSSVPLEALPVARGAGDGKAVSGVWLTATGYLRYLKGSQDTFGQGEAVRAQELWGQEFRLGIALETKRRTVRESMLYTGFPVRLTEGVAFLALVDAARGLFSEPATVRLGGDGHGAVMEEIPLPGDLDALFAYRPTGRKVKIVLATPGLFPHGWRLPGLNEDGTFEYGGLTGRLVAAVVPRYQVISGWDIRRHKPKPAVRMVPQGAEYWLELDEDAEAHRAVFEELAQQGLWPVIQDKIGNLSQETRDLLDVERRRPEGWNRVLFGIWKEA